VRGDARECLTRARRERRAERVARRTARVARVVVEESARSQTPPRQGRLAPPPPQAHRRSHGAGPFDAAGDLVANGWLRPVGVDGT
jgi:hypothetical protein